MPDARRWRSNLLESELRMFAHAVVECRDAMAIASNPDEPDWFAEANGRSVAQYARMSANYANAIMRHAREDEDSLHEGGVY